MVHILHLLLQVEIWYQNRRTQLKKESTENSKFHQTQISNEQESNLQHVGVLQIPATKNRAPGAAIEVNTEQEVPSDQGRKNSGERKSKSLKKSDKDGKNVQIRRTNSHVIYCICVYTF